MSDNATNNVADTPQFSLQKMYVKDLSFENPNAPQVFVTPAEEPTVEMNIRVNNAKVDDEHWEVSLHLNVIMRDKQSDKLQFEIELEHAAVFHVKNIPEEHIEQLLGVDCPTILFPYTRQIVSQLTIDGGFMPMLLEPINFAAAYQNGLQQKQQMN